MTGGASLSDGVTRNRTGARSVTSLGWKTEWSLATFMETSTAGKWRIEDRNNMEMIVCINTLENHGCSLFDRNRTQY